jgi:hypothetical protein
MNMAKNFAHVAPTDLLEGEQGHARQPKEPSASFKHLHELLYISPIATLGDMADVSAKARFIDRFVTLPPVIQQSTKRGKGDAVRGG